MNFQLRKYNKKVTVHTCSVSSVNAANCLRQSQTGSLSPRSKLCTYTLTCIHTDTDGGCTCQCALPSPGPGIPTEVSEGSGCLGRLGTREVLPSTTGLSETSSGVRRRRWGRRKERRVSPTCIGIVLIFQYSLHIDSTPSKISGRGACW